jgi:hypothetical protein
MCDLGRDPSPLATLQPYQPIARHRLQRAREVRLRLVIRDSSSSEAGACSAITLSRSRLPADRTVAKDWMAEGGLINPSNGLGFLWKKALDARHKAGHDQPERS